MITYCTNIHPAHTWPETWQQVRAHIPPVKQAVLPDQAFAVGLRLSNRAACELDDREAGRFAGWCEANGCYIGTINGFAYDSFYERALKEKVYTPDWRSPERAAYTCKLARLLDRWLPRGRTGSVSTLPLGFGSHMTSADWTLVIANIRTTAEYMDRLRQKSGKPIILAFEPEPGCMLQTAADMVDMMDRLHARRVRSDHIGICLDCCHHAVMFEPPGAVLKCLSEARVKIGKVQVSNALCMRDCQLEALESFDEDCYLHQTVVRSAGGRFCQYTDLPEAFRRHPKKDGDQWRVHYHLPLFMSGCDHFSTTWQYTIDILTSGTRMTGPRITPGRSISMPNPDTTRASCSSIRRRPFQK